MNLKKVLLTLVMLIVLSSTIAFATETAEPVTTSLNSDSSSNEIQIEENDYFVCEENANLDGVRVMGNLFIVASTAQLSDVHTEGSIFIVTQNLNMTNVFAEGSLYVVAETVDIKSSNFKNVYTVSKDIKLTDKTMLEKNFYTVSENCEYNATVNQDMDLLVKNINVGNEAIVAGNLNISSSTEPKIPESAIIEKYNFNKITDDDTNADKGFDISATITSILAYVLSTVVLTVLILKVTPKFKEKLQNYQAKKLAINGLIGAGLVILIPIISIIAMCTFIGVRIGIVVLLLYIIAIMIATPVTSIIIGLLIAKKQNVTDTKKTILFIAIVSLIISILEVIPVISGLVMVLCGLVGFGTIFVLPFSKNAQIENETK